MVGRAVDHRHVEAGRPDGRPETIPTQRPREQLRCSAPRLRRIGWPDQHGPADHTAVGERAERRTSGGHGSRAPRSRAVDQPCHPREMALRGARGRELPYDGPVPDEPVQSDAPGTGSGDLDGAISIEEIEEAVVDGDSPVPARTGTARAALGHRTFRIVFLRGVRLEHRDVDAERRPGGVCVRPHALEHVRRRHHLRPTRPDAGPAHVRWPAGRQGGPQAVPDRAVHRAARVLAGSCPGRPVAPPLACAAGA